ncbi:zinc-binding dehydrogenase [Nonomuraea terrae]|uniref:zinc-binding dehydrogenase n=1 Tax=Nonomuraea terrae TaxID=2530383 RepID=UPI001FE9027C|nr:zinc-binding dehydrogenase [Nonomuraea terrae]
MRWPSPGTCGPDRSTSTAAGSTRWRRSGATSSPGTAASGPPLRARRRPQHAATRLGRRRDRPVPRVVHRGVRPGDRAARRRHPARAGRPVFSQAAVQGARPAGAGSIIAVDREAGTFDLARSLGAIETLEAGPDVRKRVRALTGGRGADHALDCVGLAATIRDAYGMTRRGGRVTIVGIGGKDQKVEFSALELFHFARTITGCVAGSLDPDRDLPRLYEHAVDGTVDLASLISRETDLHGIDAAFDDMAAGRVARVLVRPDA